MLTKIDGDNNHNSRKDFWETYFGFFIPVWIGMMRPIPSKVKMAVPINNVQSCLLKFLISATPMLGSNCVDVVVIKVNESKHDENIGDQSQLFGYG